MHTLSFLHSKALFYFHTTGPTAIKQLQQEHRMIATIEYKPQKYAVGIHISLHIAYPAVCHSLYWTGYFFFGSIEKI
jgi:hypothetical protein